MSRTTTLTSVVLAGFLALGSVTVRAADEKTGDASKEQAKKRDRIVHAETFALIQGTGVRASKLDGLQVVNNQGEVLGTVDDTVIDIKTGRVAYFAMSVGGFLGIGDKLIVVPFNAVAFTHQQGKPDEHLLVFDITKDRLKNSPGFNQDHWPATMDQKFWVEVDRFYKVDSKDPSKSTGKDSSTSTK